MVCCNTLDKQLTAMWPASFVLWRIARDKGIAAHQQAIFSVQVCVMAMVQYNILKSKSK